MSSHSNDTPSHHQRNDQETTSISPISRLPPDIIQEIFILSSQDSRKRNKEASLLTSWVCRSWRALALETAALWSCIDFLNPEWVETALSRTRNCELSFYFVLPAHYKDEESNLCSLCLKNLPRIHTLFIRSAWNAVGNKFPRRSPLWVNPAPVLVQLNLHGVSLPSNLFSGIFLSIKSLVLDKCEFNWDDLPIRNGIETLRITSPVFQTSAEGLVKMVSIVAPSIDELALRKTLFPPKASIPAPDFLQPLSKITTLELNGEPAGALTHLFNHFALPLQSPFNVTIWMGGNIEQFETLRSIISSRGRAEWPTIHLDIDIQEEYVTISARENLSTINGRVEDADPDSHVSWTFDMSQGISDSDIIPIIASFPFPPIKSLSFSGGYFESHGPDLIDHCNVQGQVDWLDMSIFYAPTFTSAIDVQLQRIHDFIDDRDITNLDDVTKQQIRDIINFHHLTTLRYYGEGDTLGRRYYDLLAKWLEWRKEVGLGLKLLVFMEMKIPPKSYLQPLFEGIVEVEYNEVSVEDDEESAFPFTSR